MAITLDAYDRKILELLQENNRLSQRELADSVNLSASAVNRRIAALEANKVIRANVALVDPELVGRPITLMVEVKIENERLDLLDEVTNRFVRCPQIQQVYYVTGDFDFLLVLSCKDMTEYERLTRELFFTAGNVKKFRTVVAMNVAKSTLQVPLGDVPASPGG
ncbi:Lrp/AsnC family transcriptional regulator [Bordetella bronchiseptica]|uniref:Lrp/AsnC family transcriptional regulator n=1 Tax=Bordetella bronchiseptica TaxID=518 RepID=UPI00081C3A1C|nr:Lrp/AsnC family transcriptional regulator [Bordetella bronchiseptica]AOB26058.1 DNA-binding protein [Bordetella bronchiseptica]AZW43342.1 Lrp/AsnC family transcriptional regulator [Bordetella bronchiseptica]